MEDLIDTHCHIHDTDYDFLIDEVLQQAQQAQIVQMICVGTSLRSSRQALDFCQQNPQCYASLGLHPHLATRSLDDLELEFRALADLARQVSRHCLVAIGECGLDYFYHQDQAILKRQQILFKWHLKLAQDLDLPLIFHIRDAFADFWAIYKTWQLPGVIHSFSDTASQVERGLKQPELYFGLNGIMTFTNVPAQLKAARLIPPERLVLETDAPFLTPRPWRGKLNQPQYLRLIHDFLVKLRGENSQVLAAQTTANARRLFKI